MIILRSKEVQRIQESKKWLLVYGRRKTGKTFLLRNFVHFDEYFFVKKDRGILTQESASISYDTFLELFKRGIADNKNIIVDEFHRLGDDFFDLLHALPKKGKVILVSSTLFLSKKLLSEKSALLGLFAEVPVSLIHLTDTLASVQKLRLPKKEGLELALLLQEPIAVDYVDEKKPARELFAEIILASLKTIPALVGEIFSEEGRELSARYEGILRAIASRKENSGEISHYLFSKNILKKDDPSIIQQYLNNLLSFGLIRRIELFGKKKFVYKLTSPLITIYYYLDEKYNFSEQQLEKKTLIPFIDEIIPHLIEDAVRSFLAEKYGLRESIIQEKNIEIDGCLLHFQKPE
ncbi:AAA family ATPase, partial [Candidatus Woesearchaeota archaeon]|nr:AAA family ATPase [Candidatus Woesearchaeota archaeon]